MGRFVERDRVLGRSFYERRTVEEKRKPSGATHTHLGKSERNDPRRRFRSFLPVRFRHRRRGLHERENVRCRVFDLARFLAESDQRIFAEERMAFVRTDVGGVVRASRLDAEVDARFLDLLSVPSGDSVVRSRDARNHEHGGA